MKLINEREWCLPVFNCVLNTTKRIDQVEISGSNFSFDLIFWNEYIIIRSQNNLPRPSGVCYDETSYLFFYSSARHVQNRNQLCFLWEFFCWRLKKFNSASLYPKCHFDVERALTHTHKQTNKPIKILLLLKNETLLQQVMFFFLLLDWCGIIEIILSRSHQ